MHHDEELKLSNYNYGADELVSRVNRLIRRDSQLLGLALQRTVVARNPIEGVSHVATRIDLLPATAQVPGSQLIDYGTLVLSSEVLRHDELISRLQMFEEKQFLASDVHLRSTGIGFSDRYLASNNEFSIWPCTVFEVSFGGTQLSQEPMLHARLRSYPSPFAAIQDFLDLPTLNNMSDARLGRVTIAIPNLNARMLLRLDGQQLAVEIEGPADPSRLKLDVSFKQEGRASFVEEILKAKSTTVSLAFRPTELNVWLLSLDGFICDYHDENQLYSTGSNAVLPKRKLKGGPVPLLQPSDFYAAAAVESENRRIFVVHGHHTGLREMVARFLENLDLEPVILQEQPSGGNTIIEKFEVHADVVFAVALLTGDDEARKRGFRQELRSRARQNVIFEFGYFIGKLGRARVCALVEEGLEIPSDYSGVIFIPVDPIGNWRMRLVKELKGAGIDVDANRAI